MGEGCAGKLSAYALLASRQLLGLPLAGNGRLPASAAGALLLAAAGRPTHRAAVAMAADAPAAGTRPSPAATPRRAAPASARRRGGAGRRLAQATAAAYDPRPPSFRHVIVVVVRMLDNEDSTQAVDTKNLLLDFFI